MNPQALRTRSPCPQAERACMDVDVDSAVRALHMHASGPDSDKDNDDKLAGLAGRARCARGEPSGLGGSAACRAGTRQAHPIRRLLLLLSLTHAHSLHAADARARSPPTPAARRPRCTPSTPAARRPRRSPPTPAARRRRPPLAAPAPTLAARAPAARRAPPTPPALAVRPRAAHAARSPLARAPPTTADDPAPTTSTPSTAHDLHAVTPAVWSVGVATANDPTYMAVLDKGQDEQRRGTAQDAALQVGRAIAQPAAQAQRR
eukprot:XP_020400102.1 transcription initiation factor TFIID subunit 4-like [Zea mays]